MAPSDAGRGGAQDRAEEIASQRKEGSDRFCAPASLGAAAQSGSRATKARRGGRGRLFRRRSRSSRGASIKQTTSAANIASPSSAMTFPALCAPARARPHVVRPGHDRSFPPRRAPRARRAGFATETAQAEEAKRQEVEKAATQARRPTITAHFGPAYGGAPGPVRAKGARRTEASHSADMAGPEAKPIVEHEARDRKRGPDHQKDDQHGDHQRRERGRDRGRRLRREAAIDIVGRHSGS